MCFFYTSGYCTLSDSPIGHCFVVPQRSSLWPIGPGSRGCIRPLSQLIRQCGSVYLQCSGGPSHPDALETPLSGQQRQLLHQPPPWICLFEQSCAGYSAVLQVESSHGGLWRCYGWVKGAFNQIYMITLNHWLKCIKSECQRPS